MKMTSDKRAIDKIYRRRDRYEIPDWQRGEVWSRDTKQNLIDSILRGWKLPKFYFLKLSDEEFEVLGGQQRLTSIYEFFGNELPLTDKSTKEFGGKYYKDLPQKFADNFDDFEIEFDLIEDSEDKDMKEFFLRLQQGLPLTSSEKLNAIHSKLRDFCRKMAEHEFLKKKVTASNKRYGHFDILSKVSAIEIEGVDVGLRYEDIKEVFEHQASFSPSSNIGKRIKSALDYLNVVFDEEKDSPLRNRTIVQSIITLSCNIIKEGRSAGTEERLRNFFDNFMEQLSHQVELGQKATDQDYIDFQRTVSANVRDGARKRHTILLRKLLVFDPMFVELFGPTAIAQSGVNESIKELGVSISELVNSLNTSHAAKYGEDLIKPTNKTSRAFTKIGKPISDFTSYQSLVDSLYFLFHEGPGLRLQGNKPSSFSDINVLRTELRHDTDHGEAKKVRAKRRKGGEVFRKYAGSGTPETLAPEKFPALHASTPSRWK